MNHSPLPWWLLCYVRSPFLRVIFPRGAPCVSIPWWRSDTNSMLRNNRSNFGWPILGGGNGNFAARHSLQHSNAGQESWLRGGCCTHPCCLSSAPEPPPLLCAHPCCSALSSL